MNRSTKLGTIALPTAAVVTLFLVTLAPFQVAAANGTLNSVLLNFQTTGSAPITSYSVIAYNASGIPVANYQGQFAQVALQLPAGKYLFAVDASGPSPRQPCNEPATATGASTAVPAIIIACGYNSVVQYGYSLTTISAPTTVSITTQQASALPTTDATVTVDYKNGTAVSGAQVSTSVVGAGYDWGSDQKLQMYAQTGSDGVAHLVVPVAPLLVTAWKSVPITLPKTQTTVQVEVGGQLVNVTIYYGPTSVYLHGTALMVPPQTSASMTLTAEQSFPVVPYVLNTAGGVALPQATTAQGAPPTAAPTVTAGTNSTQSVQVTAIPPLPVDVIAAPSPPAPVVASQAHNAPDLALAAGGMALVALAVAMGLAVSKRRRQ